jgi:hypothetical protein
VYRRTVDDQILDFGTTGALRNSNLLMYDRQTETWWQEVGGEGVIGHFAGRKLEQLYLSIVSWADFKAAHPDGQVLSRPDSGRNYGQNPYAGYDRPGSEPFLFKGEKDPRLPAVERVVAVERGNEAWAVPFSTLAEKRVVTTKLGGEDIVVFWSPGTASALDSGTISGGRDVGAAGIFSPLGPDGNTLTFAPDAEGRIIDEQTGSRWDIFGRAIHGPLESERLTPAPGHVGQLWFSWAVYRPDTVVYDGPG